MEESQPPPLPQADPEKRRGMSLAARLLNVFAVPGQVFGELRNAPTATSNWLVPAFFSAIIGVIWVLVILSQPAIEKQLQEKQTQLLEERTKSGKLTPEERVIAERFTGPTVQKVFFGTGEVLRNFLSVVWWGFLLWFLARRMLRVQISFAKALEVAGLSMMINVLGGIVAMLLIVTVARTGTAPSIALVIKDFDATHRGPLFSVAANLFSFWVVGVRSVGLAKLTDAPFLRAAWLVLTCWVLEQCFLVVSGVGQLSI